MHSLSPPPTARHQQIIQILIGDRCLHRASTRRHRFEPQSLVACRIFVYLVATTPLWRAFTTDACFAYMPS